MHGLTRHDAHKSIQRNSRGAWHRNEMRVRKVSQRFKESQKLLQVIALVVMNRRTSRRELVWTYSRQASPPQHPLDLLQQLACT